MSVYTCSYLVLIAEDDTGLGYLMDRKLSRRGFSTNTVSSGSEALSFMLSEDHPDDVLMVLDYQLGDMTAPQIIDSLQKAGRDAPFVVVTGYGSEGVAVEMMKLGARDYIVKNEAFLDLLVPVIKQVVEKLETEKKLESTEEALRKEKTHLLNNIPDMVFQIDGNGF